MKDENQSKAFLLGVLVNCLWATSFLGSKYTLDTWSPITSSFLRFVLASLAMVCVFPLLKKKVRFPRKSEWLGIGLVALFQFGLLYPFQLSGLKFIPTSLSAAIMLFSPLIVILFAFLWLHESITGQKMIAIAIGIIGGVILLRNPSTMENVGLEGILFTIGAAISLAAGIILTRRYAVRIEPGHLTLWSMLLGSLFLFPLVLVEDSAGIFAFSWEDDRRSILALFYLAFICSGLTFYLWNLALSMTPAKNLASTMHLKTPVAILLGIFLAGEILTLSIIFGTIIVFIGVWLSQAKIRKPKPKSVPPEVSHDT